MMVTTHDYIQRMNVFLKRYRAKTNEVSGLMHTLREPQDASAEADQTFNHSRTDSEKSDDEQVQVEQT